MAMVKNFQAYAKSVQLARKDRISRGRKKGNGHRCAVSGMGSPPPFDEGKKNPS